MRDPLRRANRLWQAFLQLEVAYGGLDRAVGALYRWGGWLLFTWPAQVLYVIASVAGLVLFGKALTMGGYGVVTIGGSYVWGVVGLVAANLASIFVHEIAHALTVKHYGREVRRGGFLVFFGMPAFFVDTTDIWLENKRARLAVTWSVHEGARLRLMHGHRDTVMKVRFAPKQAKVLMKASPRFGYVVDWLRSNSHYAVAAPADLRQRDLGEFQVAAKTLKALVAQIAGKVGCKHEMTDKAIRFGP